MVLLFVPLMELLLTRSPAMMNLLSTVTSMESMTATVELTSMLTSLVMDTLPREATVLPCLTEGPRL